jgi:2-polyprenyl-3-methyl-5-hydroxy-6-metoxy-1,4-benzoquinol methylase
MSQYKDYSYSDDLATHAHQYLLHPILNVLAKNKPLNILDLGCGNGSLVFKLLKEGYEAYGTDASEQGIAIAQSKYPDRFVLQNLDHDDLPETLSRIPFDTVISTEVIEHLYDPRAFIDFCKKILIKNPDGGQIILSTPYHGYLKNLSLAIAGKWDSHANPLWDGGHIKLWSRETLGKLLQEKGFVVTDFIGCGRVPYLWKSMVICARLKK